jgi:DNA-binding XRE family transcriptional regulator
MTTDFDELTRPALADPTRRWRGGILEQAYKPAADLTALREQRGLTQEDVARALEVGRANVSRLGSGHDLFISILAAYVNALGGTLRIDAVFDDEVVPVACIGPGAAGNPVTEDAAAL